MNEQNVPQILLIFSKYFWAVAILFSCINAIVIGRGIKNIEIKERTQITIAAAFWLSVPWIVMGIGATIGGVPSFWHFLKPRDGNPFVIAWWAAVAAVYLIGAYWIYIGNGAAKLARYEILILRILGKRTAIKSEAGVKVIFLLMLILGIAIGAIIWFVNPPLPGFIK